MSHRTTLPLLPLTILGSVTPALAQEETAEAIGAGVGLVIGLLIAIVIGAIVGWLAGLIVKGGGSGFWSNVLVGIGGSILANVLLSFNWHQLWERLRIVSGCHNRRRHLAGDFPVDPPRSLSARCLRQSIG